MKQLLARMAVMLYLVDGGCSLAAAADTEQQLATLSARLDALEAENRALRASLAGAPSSPNSPADPAALNLPREGVDGPVLWQMEQRLSELESRVGSDEALPCPTGDCDDGAEDLTMTAKWNHGLELSTKDKDFRVHVGGRTQFDSGWFDAPPNVQNNINHPYEDGVDFRRARLRVDGTMYGVIEWVVEYDFVNAFRVDDVDRAVTAPTDLWWECKETPWLGHVRIGNQKPAIGMEHLTSSRFLPFMERSYNQDTFYGGGYNGFLPGIAAFDSLGDDEHGTYNVGLFKPTNNVFAFNATDGDYMVLGRLTRLLWYECEGASLFHVGGSMVQQSTVNDRTIFRTRDAIRTGLASVWPVPASTGEV
jgi:phosphate-selective porin OprO and OprP